MGLPRPNQEAKEKMKLTKIKKRDNFEKKMIGDFELIYPLIVEE